MRRPVLIGLTLGALALAGCGGSGTSTTTTTGPTLGPTARWGAPAGPFAGQPPKAVVMLIHGGGWRGIDRVAYADELGRAATFQRLGYATMTIDYRAGAAGLADADRYYAAARRRVGRLPICAYGESAGGHMALWLAVRHPDLACAISLAGPTDLTALSREPGAKVVTDFARTAFGAQRLAQYSPALHADSIRARLLVVAATNDPLVPVEQAWLMARAHPATRTIILPAGDLAGEFVHGPVDSTAADRATEAELAFLAQAVG